MKAGYHKTHRVLAPLAMAMAIGLALQAALPAAYAAESSETHGQLSMDDYKFATAASQGGMLEVNLGKMASEKSADPAVQQFGQRMVQDHGKAGKDLQDIAARKGATLSTDPTADQQKQIDRLGTLAGSEFDKAYISYMIKDHKADLKEFKHAAEKGEDADLKNFAAGTVPMIQDHLKMAEGMEEGAKAKMSLNK